MLFASAVANDGVDDAWASAELAKFSTRVSSLTGVVGSESAVAQTGLTTYGCGLQSGMNYMAYQWPPWVQSLEAYRTANGISKAAFYTSAFDAVISGLYWLVYSLRPDAVAANHILAVSAGRSSRRSPPRSIRQPRSRFCSCRRLSGHL